MHAAATTGETRAVARENPQLSGATPHRPARRLAASWIPGSLYAVLAIELLAFCTLVGLRAAVRAGYPPPDPHDYWRVVDVGWGVLATAAFLWGSACLVLAHRPGWRHRPQRLQIFAAVCACGVIAATVHSIAIARVAISPLAPLDIAAMFPVEVAEAEAAVPDALAPGDAGAGRRIFSASCTACHGVTGDGLANLAPSLRTSRWVQDASAADMARVIRDGRAIGDPDNTTGQVMPARGGNPFLTEQDISDLAAWVRALVEPGAEGPVTDEAAVVPLGRWVVPPPPDPPPGLAAGVPGQEGWLLDAHPVTARDQQASLQLHAALVVALTSLHLIHVLGATAAGLLWIGRRLWTRQPAARLRTHFSLLWHFAAATWLVLFTFLYLF